MLLQCPVRTCNINLTATCHTWLASCGRVDQEPYERGGGDLCTVAMPQVLHNRVLVLYIICRPRAIRSYEQSKLVKLKDCYFIFYTYINTLIS